MPPTSNPVLDRLLNQRGEQETFIDQLLARVNEDDRDLVDAERSNLEAARQRIAELDAQITPLEEFETIRQAHRAAAPAPARQSAGGDHRAPTPLTINPRGQEYPSPGDFIVDFIRARGYPGVGYAPDSEARERVSRALGRDLDQFMQARAITNQTTTETPGLLPEPTIGQINTDLDAARPLIATFGARPLGGIPGKKFNRPVVTQHTLVGEQTAEKAELPSRQLKIDSVEWSKRTFGGALDVSRQDIDWTSPAAWNAILEDLQGMYAAFTDDECAQDFAAAVTNEVPLAAADDITAWVKALYDAAAAAATGGVQARATAARLPNHIWVSIDQWASLGIVIDSIRVSGIQSLSPGTSSPTAFAGDILNVPRTVVPGFPDGTVIVGRTDKFEVYEERIGLLSAVEPKLLGVEIAYGGYAAWGPLDATCFAKVTPAGP